MHRRSLIAAGLIGLAALVGCGPRWRVVIQASPDVFRGQRKFAVLPIDYSGLRIGRTPEGRYLAGKDAEERQGFLGDKAAVDEEFRGALISAARNEGIEVGLATVPSAAPFLIRPYVNFMDPGFLSVVSSSPSHIELTLRITTPDGRVLDEVRFAHGTPTPNPTTMSGVASADTMSSGGRWRADGRELGLLAARYLATRVAGE